MDLTEHFMSKVTVNENGCWIYDGSRNAQNYAQCYYQGRMWGAHRVFYKLFKGPLELGVPLDHLCHSEAVAMGACEGGPTCPHRPCTNPGHLEITTPAINTMRGAGNGRKTHCPQGHPYDVDTYRAPDGSRKCRECNRSRMAGGAPRRKGLVCKRDHDLTGDNAGVRANGEKWCRTCQRDAQRARYAAKRADA